MNPVAELDISGVLKEVLSRHEPKPSSLIGVLQDLQAELNYLPREALEAAARALDVPRAQVYHVATFYKAFSLEPRGRHTISVCRGTACHVKGADKILDLLKASLGVGDGETTTDSLFSIQSVRCLGCCSLAPAIMIDREVYGFVDGSKLRKILDSYRNGK